MASLNRVELIGNLTAAPEVKVMPDGRKVCNFSIATNFSYKVDGQKIDKSDFHRVNVYGKLVDICEKYLKKGQKIFIAGRLSNRSWEKDGVKRYATDIIVNEMIMLGSKGEGNNAPEPTPTGQYQDDAGVEIDDLPF